MNWETDIPEHLRKQWRSAMIAYVLGAVVIAGLFGWFIVTELL